MKEEKILTKHPLCKSRKNIDRQKYEAVKRTILSALLSRELTYTELFKQLNKNLNKNFQGTSVGMEKPLSST